MQAVRSKSSRPALAGRRCNRLGYVAAMRERQPRGQLVGRLFWGLAIEGHHRRRHARLPGQLSTPTVADGRHLDVVRTPTNGFFKMFDDHLSGGLTAVRECLAGTRRSPNQSGVPVILRGRHDGSSEGKREGGVHNPLWARSSADPAKEKSAFAGCPQDFHVTSTAFPQLGSVRFNGSALASRM